MRVILILFLCCFLAAFSTNAQLGASNSTIVNNVGFSNAWANHTAKPPCPEFKGQKVSCGPRNTHKFRIYTNNTLGQITLSSSCGTYSPSTITLTGASSYNTIFTPNGNCGNIIDLIYQLKDENGRDCNKGAIKSLKLPYCTPCPEFKGQKVSCGPRNTHRFRIYTNNTLGQITLASSCGTYFPSTITLTGASSYYTTFIPNGNCGNVVNFSYQLKDENGKTCNKGGVKNIKLPYCTPCPVLRGQEVSCHPKNNSLYRFKIFTNNTVGQITLASSCGTYSPSTITLTGASSYYTTFTPNGICGNVVNFSYQLKDENGKTCNRGGVKNVKLPYCTPCPEFKGQKVSCHPKNNSLYRFKIFTNNTVGQITLASSCGTYSPSTITLTGASSYYTTFTPNGICGNVVNFSYQLKDENGKTCNRGGVKNVKLPYCGPRCPVLKNYKVSCHPKNVNNYIFTLFTDNTVGKIILSSGCGTYSPNVINLTGASSYYTTFIPNGNCGNTINLKYLMKNEDGKDCNKEEEKVKLPYCGPRCPVLKNYKVSCHPKNVNNYIFTLFTDNTVGKIILSSGCGTYSPNVINLTGASSYYTTFIPNGNCGNTINLKYLMKNEDGKDCNKEEEKVKLPYCGPRCECDKNFYISVDEGFEFKEDCPNNFVRPHKLLDKCDKVTWTYDGLILGQSDGNDPFIFHHINAPGELCMTVVRTPSFGRPCKKSICKYITPRMKCKPIIILPSSPSARINVNPNPASSTIMVTWNNQEIPSELTVRVFNSNGVVVKTVQDVNGFDGNTSLPIYDLPTGLYFLQIQGEGYTPAPVKFIKK